VPFRFALTPFRFALAAFGFLVCAFPSRFCGTWGIADFSGTLASRERPAADQAEACDTDGAAAAGKQGSEWPWASQTQVRAESSSAFLPADSLIAPDRPALCRVAGRARTRRRAKRPRER
jgi:hypothetical protein